MGAYLGLFRIRVRSTVIYRILFKGSSMACKTLVRHRSTTSVTCSTQIDCVLSFEALQRSARAASMDCTVLKESFSRLRWTWNALALLCWSVALTTQADDRAAQRGAKVPRSWNGSARNVGSLLRFFIFCGAFGVVSIFFLTHQAISCISRLLTAHRRI